jgi:hypothetical protein
VRQGVGRTRIGDFRLSYPGLANPCYQFTADARGNINLWANTDGFEHLARFFLKMARSDKSPGYDSHHTLEFGDPTVGGPELTIGIKPAPDDAR